MADSTALTHLLDSVILIDHFNGITAATEFLRQVHPNAAISVITRAEVLAGFDEETAPVATSLLDRFPTLGVDLPIADLAAQLRREHRWKLPDAFQAALATYHGLRLATRNSKDFPPGKHAFVEVPYEV